MHEKTIKVSSYNKGWGDRFCKVHLKKSKKNNPPCRGVSAAGGIGRITTLKGGPLVFLEQR